MLTQQAWAAVPGLRHGFLDAVECAGAPSWDAVVGTTVVTARQVHGARVVRVEDAIDRPPADALIARGRGVVAGVLTADCVPVLLLARDAHAAAAVHAGWRGAAAGVVEAALAALDVPPGEVEATIGPAIGPCCYPVGAEVCEAFTARTGDVTAPAWSTRDGRLAVDLRHAVGLLLAAAGVRHTALVGPCTACTPGFCSYRRDGANAGRQLSFIGWA